MRLHRTSMIASFALAAVTLGAAPAGPMAAVRQFTDGFNAANVKAMQAQCATATAVIDDFPPHTWMSCGAWYDDFVSFSKKNGDTTAKVSLGMPAHVDVTGNVAYVVVPTTYTFNHRGKPTTQTGSTWTLIVKNTPAGWRITAWAWADGK